MVGCDTVTDSDLLNDLNGEKDDNGKDDYDLEGDFAGGSGTEADPYLVATADQLNNVRNHLDRHFKQVAIIDLEDYSAGQGWEPIGDHTFSFTGLYDGNGYKIINLRINDSDESYVGLFGYVGDFTKDGNISNVYLEDVDVTETSMWDDVGGLAGRLRGWSNT